MSEAVPGKAPSLKRSAIRGSLWTFIGYGIAQILRLANNLIMTRLLVPEMFGVMATVSVIMIGLELCSDAGLMGCVVRNEKGHKEHFLNTAWTVKVIRGFILWGVACFMAFGIALAADLGWAAPQSVYAEPLLPWLIVVVGLSTVMTGFTSTNMFLANRNLALGRMTMIEIISQAFSIVVMIIWAMIDPSVWALAAGYLAKSFLKMILSHTSLPGSKNRLTWDKEVADELYRFGKWVFIASGLTFLANQGDRLMLGAYLTAHDFGIYSISAFIVLSFDNLFSKLTLSVWFPAMCRVNREKPNQLAGMFYKVRLIQQLATVTTAITLMFLGEYLIDLLFDTRYKEAGPLTELLGLMLVFSSLNIGIRCLMARGVTVVNTSVVLSRAIVLWSSIPIAFHFAGLYGVLWAIVVNPLSGYPIILLHLAREKIVIWGREIFSIVLWSVAIVCACFIPDL